MICNLDRVANPSPCDVDRSQYLRGNPNSNHKLGYETTRVLNETKSKLKAHFNNAYTSVEFTPGGGSVANKRAINGSILFHPKRLTKDTYRDKIVVSSIEHKSINETVLRELSLRGYDIIKLPVDAGGRIRMDDMVKVVQQNKDQIALVSIMSVNNENGAKQDILSLCRVVKAINPSILFHSDVSASFLSARNNAFHPDRANSLPDVLSMSVYKLGGPHIGLIMSTFDLSEEYFGTKDMESIQFAFAAIEKYFERMANESILAHVLSLKRHLKEEVAKVSESLKLEIVDVSPHSASVDNIQAFLLPDGYEAKIVQSKLSDAGVFVGTGSACSSLHNRGSHVVEAMGFSQGNGLLRFSFDYLNTNEEMTYAAQSMEAILKQLQEIKSHEEPMTEYDVAKSKKVKVQHIKTSYNHKHRYEDKKAEQQSPSQPSVNTNETILPACQTVDHPASSNKSPILVIKKDDKYNAKDYQRIDLPLDLPESQVTFTSVKLHCAELYLKGNNKKFYFKQLWKNLKSLGVSPSDMVAKENVIIVKRSENLEIGDFLRVTGLAKLIPCYIVEKRLFKTKQEPESEATEAENGNIDLERDDDESERSDLSTSEAESTPTPQPSKTDASNAVPTSQPENSTKPNEDNANVTASEPQQSQQETPETQTGKKPRQKAPYSTKNTHGGKKAKLWRDKPRPKRPEPEILEPKDDEYLKRIVSIMCGLVSHALEKKRRETGDANASLRFKITANFVLTKYFNMSRGDFQIKVGQYLRDRFNGPASDSDPNKKEQVIVDLKNFDLDLQVTLYHDMATIASEFIVGTGGLPANTNGGGLLIADAALLEDLVTATAYRNRLNVASLMATTRGCQVADVCCYGDLTMGIMEKYDFYMMEPTQYNDARIYSSFKFLEDALKKPVFSVTNLMTDEEVNDKLRFLQGRDHFRFMTAEMRDKKEKEERTTESERTKRLNLHYKTLAEEKTAANEDNATNETESNTEAGNTNASESKPRWGEKEREAERLRDAQLYEANTVMVRNLQANLVRVCQETRPIKRVLVLLSGGIDSPVAAHLLMRAGYQVDFVHFSADIDKINNIISLRNTLNKESKIYVVSFSPVQEKIVLTSDESYRTLMYKVFMVKISANIARNHGYDALATGNALSQVASQTVENIKCTHFHSAEFPLITPLFGYNKEDITIIARRIDTFVTSTCDGTSDCCVMYMPKNPKTKANPNIVMKFVDEVPDELVKSATIKCI